LMQSWSMASGKSGSSELESGNLGETIWRPNLSRVFADLAVLPGTRGLGLDSSTLL
jgi:hypothetical protein